MPHSLSSAATEVNKDAIIGANQQYLVKCLLEKRAQIVHNLLRLIQRICGGTTFQSCTYTLGGSADRHFIRYAGTKDFHTKNSPHRTVEW